MRLLRPLAALLVLPAPLGFLGLVPGCSSGVTSPFAAAGNPAGEALGAPCAFDDQCVTGRCSADPALGTCGACVTMEPLGQPCTGPHQGCSVSAVCKNGVCTSVRKVEGETCALYAKGGDRGECDVELFCERVDGQLDEGICTRRVPLGGSCGEGGVVCVLGAACEKGACAIPTPNACWYKYGCDYGYTCGDDQRCHRGTLTEGEACGLVDGHFVDNECGPGLVCRVRTCVPALGVGEQCMYWQCAEGLFCHVSLESDALSFCEVPRAEGEPCSNYNVAPIPCAKGLECRGEVCRAPCSASH